MYALLPFKYFLFFFSHSTLNRPEETVASLYRSDTLNVCTSNLSRIELVSWSSLTLPLALTYVAYVCNTIPTTPVPTSLTRMSGQMRLQRPLPRQRLPQLSHRPQTMPQIFSRLPNDG